MEIFTVIRKIDCSCTPGSRQRALCPLCSGSGMQVHEIPLHQALMRIGYLERVTRIEQQVEALVASLGAEALKRHRVHDTLIAQATGDE